jgi:hypothetical protein
MKEDPYAGRRHRSKASESSGVALRQTSGKYSGPDERVAKPRVQVNMDVSDKWLRGQSGNPFSSAHKK